MTGEVNNLRRNQGLAESIIRLLDQPNNAAGIDGIRGFRSRDLLWVNWYRLGSSFRCYRRRGGCSERIESRGACMG